MLEGELAESRSGLPQSLGYNLQSSGCARIFYGPAQNRARYGSRRCAGENRDEHFAGHKTGSTFDRYSDLEVVISFEWQTN